MKGLCFNLRPVLNGDGDPCVLGDGHIIDLDLLFVSPKAHSKGIGYAAWCAVERLHPEVAVWETVTPYFEKRNIHFYVNRCGFHIVEFFNNHHPDQSTAINMEARPSFSKKITTL